MCLDAAGYAGQAGANVGVYRCEHLNDQRWQRGAARRRQLRVSTIASRTSASNANGQAGARGDNVLLWNCDGGADQRWTFEPWTASPPRYVGPPRHRPPGDPPEQPWMDRLLPHVMPPPPPPQSYPPAPAVRPIRNGRLRALKSAIDHAGFSQDKLTVIEDAARSSYFLVGQAKEILGQLAFSAEKLHALDSRPGCSIARIPFSSTRPSASAPTKIRRARSSAATVTRLLVRELRRGACISRRKEDPMRMRRWTLALAPLLLVGGCAGSRHATIDAATVARLPEPMRQSLNNEEQAVTVAVQANLQAAQRSLEEARDFRNCSRRKPALGGAVAPDRRRAAAAARLEGHNEVQVRAGEQAAEQAERQVSTPGGRSRTMPIACCAPAGALRRGAGRPRGRARQLQVAALNALTKEGAANQILHSMPHSRREIHGGLPSSLMVRNARGPVRRLHRPGPRPLGPAPARVPVRVARHDRAAADRSARAAHAAFAQRPLGAAAGRGEPGPVGAREPAAAHTQSTSVSLSPCVGVGVMYGLWLTRLS